MVFDKRNVILGPGLLGHFVGVNVVGDVSAAAADEYTDPHRLPPENRIARMLNVSLEWVFQQISGRLSLDFAEDQRGLHFTLIARMQT